MNFIAQLMGDEIKHTPPSHAVRRIDKFEEEGLRKGDYANVSDKTIWAVYDAMPQERSMKVEMVRDALLEKGLVIKLPQIRRALAWLYSEGEIDRHGDSRMLSYVKRKGW